MAKKAIGNLDDALTKLVINDFSAGLNTYSSTLTLKSNESPDMLNVIPFPGRLLFRGGWLNYASIIGAADQIYAFYDSKGNKHLVVWALGNVYDVITGVPVVVEAAVYTAGQRVGVVDLNGNLYWSTQTVPIRFWTPTTATTGQVPKNGDSNTPASPFLLLYTNAIVALGVNFTPGTPADFQSNVMAWSDVNAPDHWNSANSQAVGPNNGASLQFGLVMGIAEVGVAPFRTFVIGRSDKGLLAYSGALGSLSETLISCPVGCADGASAQFAPSAEQFGTIIFLGTDGQFYKTNGVTCGPISVIEDESGVRGIQPTLSAAYQDALTTPGNRFWSGYNEAFQYYFCTVSGQQFVYKWDLKAWTLFSGWPVGPSVNFTDLTGLPQTYIATQLPQVNGSSLAYMVGEVGLPQETDNGTVPNVYYKTPWLHMGDPKKFKEYHWISPQFYAKGAIYQVTGQSLPRAADNSSMNTKPLLFTTPVGANPFEFVLDESDLDGPDLLGGPADAELVGTGNPVVSFARLVCPYEPVGMLEGMTDLQEILKGSAAQFTVTLYPQSNVCDFELLGLEIFWLDRGYMRDGGNQYNPESGVPYGFPGYPPAFDPYVIPEVQVVPQYNTKQTYSIIDGKLVLDAAGGRIAIAMPGVPFTSAGNLVLALDNAGGQAVLPFPLDGEVGLLVDGPNNMIISEGVDEADSGQFYLKSIPLVLGVPNDTRFNPPFAAEYGIGEYYVNWENTTQGSVTNSVTYSGDKQHIFAIAQDINETGFYVLKINALNGGLEAATPLHVTDGVSPVGIFVSNDDSQVFVTADNQVSAPPFILSCYIFDAGDLSLTRTVNIDEPTTDISGLASNPNPVSAAMAPDGSTISVSVDWNFFDGPTGTPTSYPIFVFNTSAQVWSTFNVLVDNSLNYQASALTYANPSQVLIAVDNQLWTYSLSGALSIVYDLSALGTGNFGCPSIAFDPVSNCAFGNSENTGFSWLWCYSLTTKTFLNKWNLGTLLPDTQIYGLTILEQ